MERRAGLSVGRAVGLVVVLLGVSFASPSLASATTFYASPNGAVVGQCNTPANACEIHRAVGVAQPGDNVTMLPGDYTLSASLSVLGNITLHGSPGHRPRILEQGDAIVEVGNQAVMQDVEVDAPMTNSSTAVYLHDATLDRTVLDNPGTPSTGWAYGLVVRGVSYVLDSELLAPQGMGFDAWNGSITMTNDDVLGSLGMRAYYDPPNDPSQASSYPAGNVTVTIRNCILHAAGDSFDGEAYGDAGSATVNIDFSNFSSIYQSPGGTVTAGQNNQNSTAPTFVNAAAGDYREAAGSVTIDAGIASGLGSLDLAGNLRTMGAGPDIGAFEYVTKGSATTLSANAIKSTSATLHGSAVNGGEGATYMFKYGPTLAYGAHTAPRPLAVLSRAQPVAANLAGLKPGTTYHFQLVVTNSAGSVAGSDKTFVTLPNPPNTEITKEQISSAHHQAVFYFKAIGSASGFQCALVKSRQRPSYSPCSSPKTYKSLASGNYTFLVRAFNAGGPDPTPAQKTFQIT